MVKNYMEICVDIILEDLINRGMYKNVCTCEKCLDDVKAKALNNLKPYYITSKKGEVFAEYSSLEMHKHMEIFVEVTKAFEVISKNTNHNK